MTSFYHFQPVLDTMIRNGDVELQAREEEIRFLKMQLNEENRAIDLLRKNLPNKRALEQELVTLQIQVGQRSGTHDEATLVAKKHQRHKYSWGLIHWIKLEVYNVCYNSQKMACQISHLS